LDQAMLNAINADRQSNGLAPVAWDATAATAGAAHAADMAAKGYFSHRSPDGYGPEMRYIRAGGTDTTMENIFTTASHYSDGRPVPIDNVTEQVLQAEAGLMQSPGHRRNILMPSHTHVGVGFAYNPQTGSFYLVQEFVDRYVEMQPLAQTGQVGEQITVIGRLLPGAEVPLINMTYAPFPQPMSLDELNATGSYQSNAEIYAPIDPQLAGNGTFSATIPLDYRGQPGVYSVRVWVTVGGEQVLASEQLIEVQ
ncbi:MAG: CAP domain-containing protein, partial [Chloroflexales bacterium]